MARDYCQMDESNSKKQRYAVPRIPSTSAMFTTPRSIDTKLYTDACESIESVRSGNKSNVKALMNSLSNILASIKIDYLQSEIN